MAFTPQQYHASIVIQRIFRGSHFRGVILPRLRAYQPANGVHPGSVNHLNETDEFWGPYQTTGTKHLWTEFPFTPRPNSKGNLVEFATEKSVVDTDSTDPRWDARAEEIDLIDHKDTTSGRFAALINAEWARKPIFPYIIGCHDIIALDRQFLDAIKSLEDGIPVRIWDGQSTTLPVLGLSRIRSCHTKFRYFTGITKPEQEIEHEIDQELELERRINILRKMPVGKCNLKPLPTTLARAGPTTIAGGIPIHLPPIHHPKENKLPDEDDIELRFNRLLNL
jgi:hypothetical protein